MEVIRNACRRMQFPPLELQIKLKQQWTYQLFLFSSSERASEFLTFLSEPSLVMDLKMAGLYCSSSSEMFWDSSLLTGTSLKMASGAGITAFLCAEQNPGRVSPPSTKSHNGSLHHNHKKEIMFHQTMYVYLTLDLAGSRIKWLLRLSLVVDATREDWAIKWWSSGYSASDQFLLCLLLSHSWMKKAKRAFAASPAFEVNV